MKVRGRQLAHLQHLLQRDVLINIEVEEPVDLWTVACRDVEPEQIFLVLLHEESAHIWSRLVVKSPQQRLIKLRFHLIDLVLRRLDLINISRLSFVVQAVDKLLLVVVLLVGHLVLPALTLYKRFIHPVLVVESGHLHGTRRIVVAKELLHLVVARLLPLLQLLLVFHVHRLAFLVTFQTGGTVRAALLVRLPLLPRLKAVVFVEFAIAGGWLAQGISIGLWGPGRLLVHHAVSWLSLGQFRAH